MVASFIDLQTLMLFLIVSFLFIIVAYRFDFKSIQDSPSKIATIFLVSGFIVGFSDLILMLQDKDSIIMSGDQTQVAKQVGVLLLSPFYGMIFASVAWFGAGKKN